MNKISAAGIVREDIREMPPYQPILPFDVLSESLGIRVQDLIKLDANENPYGVLPQVRTALANLDSGHIYPDPESRKIRKLLSEWLGVSMETIIMGAGADELIDLLMRVLLEPGDSIINCPPTFGMYAFDADLNHANVITISRNKDFSLDLEGIQQAVEDNRPKMIFLASPNNPDGSQLADDTIEELLALPVVLVLDEAYIEFSDLASSWVTRVKEFDNLIILRTFSKWAGLAGLRLGYAVAPENLVPFLMKAKQPYNVSAATELAACTTMQNLQDALSRVKDILAERERLIEKLGKLAWLSLYPTCTNFILCRVMGKDAARTKEVLREQGILIRYFDKPGLSDHIRISVGTPQQTDRLISALMELE